MLAASRSSYAEGEGSCEMRDAAHGSSMLDWARVTAAGRGDEVDVRRGGDSARVDSGGLLW